RFKRTVKRSENWKKTSGQPMRGTSCSCIALRGGISKPIRNIVCRYHILEPCAGFLSGKSNSLSWLGNGQKNSLAILKKSYDLPIQRDPLSTQFVCCGNKQ